MHKKINNRRGYTIIETMIAVSLFIVVVMAGMGSLLNANLLHQKSQNMRSIMDSLNFIMEDIVRNVRTGYNYNCWYVGATNTIESYPTTRSCSNINGSGGWAIVFEQEDGVPDDPTTPLVNENTNDQWLYYLDGGGRVFKSTPQGGLNDIQLVPGEVKLYDTIAGVQISGFSVLGAEPPSAGNQQQPFVTIRLAGKITLKGIETPFSLQTSVSQRLIDS